MDHNPRTVVASVPVPGRRFVNRAGGLGGADVIGVSENDAVPGKPCSVITLGNAVVESAVELPAGAVVDTDADGRAVLASGIGLGVAERAAVAGGRVDVRLHGLPGVALQRVVSATTNPLTGEIALPGERVIELSRLPLAWIGVEHVSGAHSVAATTDEPADSGAVWVPWAHGEVTANTSDTVMAPGLRAIRITTSGACRYEVRQ